LAKAIASIDVPLDEGLSRANQKITDQLLLGNAFEEVLSDGVRKSFNSISLGVINCQPIAFNKAMVLFCRCFSFVFGIIFTLYKIIANCFITLC
jgi:hypothetical protein